MKKEKSGENISPLHPTSFVQSLRIIEWAGKSFIIQSSPDCLLFGCLNNVMRIPCLEPNSPFSSRTPSSSITSSSSTTSFCSFHFITFLLNSCQSKTSTFPYFTFRRKQVFRFLFIIPTYILQLYILVLCMASILPCTCITIYQQ